MVERGAMYDLNSSIPVETDTSYASTDENLLRNFVLFDPFNRFQDRINGSTCCH